MAGEAVFHPDIDAASSQTTAKRSARTKSSDTPLLLCPQRFPCKCGDFGFGTELTYFSFTIEGTLIS
jgi:hypothetical protein